MPKKAAAEKIRQTNVAKNSKKTAPAAKTTSQTPKTAEPQKKKEDLIQKAASALISANDSLSAQKGHPGNRDIDFRSPEQMLMSLQNTYREKGLLKSARDKGFDWAAFCLEVEEVERAILQTVVDHLSAKAERMVVSHGAEAFITQTKIDEIWAEAQEKDPYLPGLIYGWSNAVRSLRAAGLRDPEEEQRFRGHRQQGGKRRR